MQIVTITPST